MTQFEINNINEERVRKLFETLPTTWKEVRGVSMNVLTLVLAKMWECDDALVGFSTWYHGYTALACSIRYQRSSESCIVDVETGSADSEIFAKTEMNKRILGEAIRKALEEYQS